MCAIDAAPGHLLYSARFAVESHLLGWSPSRSPEGLTAAFSRGERAAALGDCLRDEPSWRGRLEVTELELDHEHTSLN